MDGYQQIAAARAVLAATSTGMAIRGGTFLSEHTQAIEIRYYKGGVKSGQLRIGPFGNGRGNRGMYSVEKPGGNLEKEG